MTPGQRAEARIEELGISRAADIDVDAIAADAGITVRYASLVGCEATLVGFGSRAIATIRHSTVRGRERFSVAHELGHWELHRGQSFRCRVDEPDENLASNAQLEREADQFSSHLLMPARLFNPAVCATRWPKLGEIQEVSRDFQTSQLATLIRMANVDTLPVIVAGYTQGQRRWNATAPHVPWRWRLKRVLDKDTFAYELLTRGTECSVPRKQSADAWFENDDASDFEVLEQCYSPLPGQIIVILYLSDSEMFDRGWDQGARWHR